MASRLNHLFQTAPYQFLQRTVVFVDGLTTAEASSQMRNRLSHFIDLQPSGVHARARVLSSHHLYQDAPLASYFVSPGGVTLIPRDDPPQRFVFIPEFTRCRLLVSPDGADWLQLQMEENLHGVVPPPDPGKYISSFAYWDHTSGDLVGVIRATAVLVKTPGEPWSFIMQQIVGTAGHEVVRYAFQSLLIPVRQP